MSAPYSNQLHTATATSGIQIICAGLPRCATNSLKQALQELGYPTCHMMDIFWWPDRQRKLLALHRVETTEARQEIFRELYEGYRACCDAPGPTFIDELMDLYPHAQIILNVRQAPEQWAQSFAQTILLFCSWEYWFAGMLTRLDRLHGRFHKLDTRYWRRHFGLEAEVDWLPGCYTRHNAWVREEAAKRGMPVLQWKPEDGWGPICEFLGKEVLDGDFPHTNERESLRRIYKGRVRKGLCRWAGLGVFATVFCVMGNAWLRR